MCHRYCHDFGYGHCRRRRVVHDGDMPVQRCCRHRLGSVWRSDVRLMLRCVGRLLHLLRLIVMVMRGVLMLMGRVIVR